MSKTATNRLEERLVRVLAGVARQVPDQPDAGVVESFLITGGDRVGHMTPASISALPATGSVGPRRSRNATRVGIAGAAVAVVALGGGIAAAAGVLRLPWVSQKAVSFMNSSDPATIRGAAVRLTLRGPESTVWQVVTDTTANGPDRVESCVDLAIKEANGQPERVNGGGGCAFASAPPGGQLSGSEIHPAGPSVTLTYWQAPSGASFGVVFGEAPSDSATVALTDSRGVVAAKGLVGGGYYAIYIPARDLPADGNLTFYDQAGRVRDTLNLEARG
jgi:hypothetical protein